MITDADFPRGFVNCAHSLDYVPTDMPMSPEFIYHYRAHHYRLLLRISVRVDNKYIPFTFVCDTGAPMAFYLSERTRSLIRRRIRTEEVETIQIGYRSFYVGESPSNHGTVNIMGLYAFTYFGLTLIVSPDGTYGFVLTRLPSYL
jgi:hypothetical protein